MTKLASWQGAVEQVRRTMTAVGRAQTGLYAIEGIRLHERALRAGLTLELTLLSERFSQDNTTRSQFLLANLPLANLHTVPNTLMAELTDGRNLGQLISLVKIPPDLKLEEVVTATSNPLLLVAADVVDPGNVGAMVRTGHANDIAAFVAVGVSDPFHPKAVRTSMGSLFKTAVCHYATIEPLLADLRRLGIVTVGTVATGGEWLPNASFALGGTARSRFGFAIFMGNEYHGLPHDVLRQLDKRVTIPMAGEIDSLSVNAATAVILYEIRSRQPVS
jgi:TrmH family RNA methyltransferase